MNSLYEQLVKVDLALFNAEKKRNLLNDRIRQAQVDTDNLRNRWQTFKGMRKNKRLAATVSL